MDKFKIDSHKLNYHVSRLNNWLLGENICPVYLEISPSGSCNHRCVYCALDFMGYQPKFLDSKILKSRLTEMGKLGVKSIMYAGAGEPFLHKDIVEIINHTKVAGIDVAVTTNGTLFNREIATKTLSSLSWVKVSINAGTKETYAKIHQTKPVDFDKVIENLTFAVKFKEKRGSKCALGMQIVLLPENYSEVSILAKKAKAIGMDYLVVKPYSQHPLSKTKKYKGIKYDKYLNLAEELVKIGDDKFNVIFRANTMRKWDDQKRNYKHCLALPFWSYIEASGDVYACSIYLTKNKFRIGNIYKDNFKRILEGRKRLSLLNFAKERLNTENCRVNCRMDEVNRYLWEIKNPPEHVNFI